MPQSVVTSSTVIAKRRRMKSLRRRAMNKLLDDEGGKLRDAGRREAHAAARTFRVRRRDLINLIKDEDIKVESDSSDSDDDEPKKTKKAKEIWVGGSFDIGREFESAAGTGNPDPGVEGTEDIGDQQPVTMQVVADRVLEEPATEEPQEMQEEVSSKDDNDEQDHQHSTALPTKSAASFVTAETRPSTNRAGSTSGQTFVTARTQPESVADTASTFSAHVPVKTPAPPRSASVHSSPRAVGSSRASSTRPLYGGASHKGDDDDPPEMLLSPSSKQRKSSGETARPFPQRLKSAIRGNQDEADMSGPSRRVQFPENPVDGTEEPRNGDQEPADPNEVLARSGSAINGTSADATEGMDDEDEYPADGIVMRDRVLVKVGRHKDEQLNQFDEMTERRNPCYRFDPLEEYVCGLTTTAVDFYTDWSWRIQEYFKGVKQLRFSVPLSPVTTLCIFNQYDMTLALICPWAAIVRQTARSNDPELRKQTSTWDRARHSSIADKLGIERQGAAVLIVKFCERSRALDWLWYIGGQLGLRMPRQVEMHVPAVELTLRTLLAEDATSESFNVKTVIDSVWKAILSNSEQVRLLRELKAIPQLQLVWKGADATLDWVAYQTTVTGKQRPWSLLASFAQCATVRGRRALQIRDASHRGVLVRLEDGTTLNEPAGVEGYLLRHKVGGMPKETIYVSTNDGHVFMSPMNAAMPPLRPGKTGSSPATIFPALHKRFVEGEQHRLSRFIEKCAGTFDLADVEEVEMVQPLGPPPKDVPEAVSSPPETALTPPGPVLPYQAGPSEETRAAAPKTKRTRGMSTSSRHLEPVKKIGMKSQREFEVHLRGDVKVRFEARTPEVAAEWVERLKELVKYWTLRPRVDARGAMDAVQRHVGAAAFLGNVQDLEVERTLDNIWNWCAIDGCRAITHASPIYVREGPWAKFR